MSRSICVQILFRFVRFDFRLFWFVRTFSEEIFRVLFRTLSFVLKRKIVGLFCIKKNLGSIHRNNEFQSSNLNISQTSRTPTSVQYWRVKVLKLHFIRRFRSLIAWNLRSNVDEICDRAKSDLHAKHAFHATLNLHRCLSTTYKRR